MQETRRGVAFKNNQWSVTRFGVEAVKPAPFYIIEASSLLDIRDDGFYMWPLQLADKTWVDLNAFIEAFDKALSIHHLIENPVLLRASCDKARRSMYA
jgi:hypothetical protein